MGIDSIIVRLAYGDALRPAVGRPRTYKTPTFRRLTLQALILEWYALRKRLHV